jgi:CDP-glycerol glycerophosphotransferase (TagB/SpsB family)
VEMLARQDRFNVILAPHQRLVEKAPDVREVLAAVSHLGHVHTDLDSFAMVDGSYMGAADVYLGDTSSQVVEFLIRPRPCVFLNPEAIDWRATDDHDFWACGEVVDRLDVLPDALDRAQAEHPRYEAEQRSYAAAQLGDASPEAPYRAARAVITAVG